MVGDFGGFGTFFCCCCWICCIFNKSSDLQVGGTSFSPLCRLGWVLMVETERVESKTAGSKSQTVLSRCSRLDAEIQNPESNGETKNFRRVLWIRLESPHTRGTSSIRTMGYVGCGSLSTRRHRRPSIPRKDTDVRYWKSGRRDNVNRDDRDR